MLIDRRTHSALWVCLLTMLAFFMQLYLMWPHPGTRFLRAVLRDEGSERTDALTRPARTRHFSVDILSFPESRVLTHASLGRLEAREWFRVEFTGCFRLLESDRVLFHVRSDDGFQLEIDREVVLSHPEPRAMASSAIAVPLSAGLHTMRGTWYQRKGYAGLEATYRGSHDEREQYFGESSINVRFVPVHRWSEEGCRGEVEE